MSLFRIDQMHAHLVECHAILSNAVHFSIAQMCCAFDQIHVLIKCALQRVRIILRLVTTLFDIILLIDILWFL